MLFSINSILKKKKVLYLKKIFLGCCQYQNKKALFTDPIFSEGFAVSHKPQSTIRGCQLDTFFGSTPCTMHNA